MNRPAKQPGVSLLEVSLVLVLIVLVTGVALPRFALLFDSPLDTDAKRVQYLLSRLQKEALLKGRGFKLRFDAAQNRVEVFEQDGADPELYHPLKEKGLSGFTLDPSVSMKPVKKRQDQQFQMGFQALDFDPIFGLASEVFIDPAGLVDLFSLELVTDQAKVTLSVENVMGQMTRVRSERL
ncbi:MAG: hypothetical protein RRB13_03875 [bacterium]|nr:hypothetical protein [bacterium]